MNKKKILLISLFYIFYSIGYSEELKGTIFWETNYLKLKNKNSKNLSSTNINIPNQKKWVNIWKNKNEIFNTNYYEENNILNVNDSSIGLLATGNSTQIVNSGNIILDKNGIGMSVINNANMENASSGIIELKNNSEVGMLSTSSTIGTNKGTITLSGGNNYTQAGMSSENSGTSINEGEILVNSDSSYGMLANSNSKLQGLNNQTTLVNNKKISINNSNAGIGIEAREDFSIGINNGDILINESNSARGMVSAKGAESINKGNISIVNSQGSFGMNIGDGGSITNKETSIKNNNIITLDSNTTKSIGMRVFKENGYEMAKGIGENFGNIKVLGKDNVGMLASGVNTEVVNNNKIFLSQEHNIGIQSNLKASTGINKGEIILDENANNSFGMVTFTGGNIINDGEITLNSGLNGINVGMQSVDGIAINNNQINLNNKNQVGMNAAGTGIAENKGNILINNSEGSSFGMTAKTGATIVNNNKIEMIGTGNAMSNELLNDINVSLVNKGNILLKTNFSSGMTIGQNSSILNEGTVEITGNGNTAISAKQGSIVKTNKGSSISLNGDNNTGILLSGAELINDGNISIAGSKNTGIRATQNSKVINTGIINITSGDSNIGINIEKGSSLANTGTIIIKDKDVTSTPSAGRPDKNIGIRNMGTIINSGNLSFSGDFDSNKLGTGSLIMEKNSNLEADKISGNINLSSNITTGSLKDEYSTYKMFKTDEMEANLISNSILFNAKLQNNDHYYDAILTRKNFNEVIKESNFANYLENNYINDNNQNKIAFYDKFKNISSIKEMDSLVDDTFGKTVFPTLEKQTFEMIRLNNNILKSNISKKSIHENFQYIVGGVYNKIDSDSSDNAQGYISSLKNAWIGGEKKITSTTKMGLVFSVGDYISNFTQNTHRADRILQGTFFINYDKNNLNLRTFVTYGETKANLDRVSKSYNQKLNSDFDNQYFVLSNEISKTFNLEHNIYVVPKANLTLYRLNQERIKEKNGTYPVEVNSIKSVILEPGAGIVLGKNILLKNGYILKPELEFNYFYKTGDLKNNLEGKIKSVSNDSFIIKGYEFEKNSGDGKIKISLEKENWNIYASYNLIFENKISSIGTIGINYKFN